jgi:hypothetical protein
MRIIAVAAALALFAPAGAFAQAPAADAHAHASAALDGSSPIEAIAADPAGKAALDKNFPDLTSHPAYEQFKGMSLRDIAPLSGGLITDEKIAALEATLKASH